MSAKPQSSGTSHSRDHAVDSPSASGASEMPLLDAIVSQTVAALDEQSFASVVDLPRLVDVARRHHACDALSFDPILIELIDALLQTHVPQVGEQVELRTKVATAVARPLFDNPVSRGRLELLWSQLLENAQ